MTAVPSFLLSEMFRVFLSVLIKRSVCFINKSFLPLLNRLQKHWKNENFLKMSKCPDCCGRFHTYQRKRYKIWIKGNCYKQGPPLPCFLLLLSLFLHTRTGSLCWTFKGNHLIKTFLLTCLRSLLEKATSVLMYLSILYDSHFMYWCLNCGTNLQNDWQMIRRRKIKKEKIKIHRNDKLKDKKNAKIKGESRAKFTKDKTEQS